VLPCWWDTYEFATRVEYLGVGIYGSRKSKSAPKAHGVEFGEALLALNDDGNEESKLIRERAKKLAEVCNAYGAGSRLLIKYWSLRRDKRRLRRLMRTERLNEVGRL
jgi:hypothetical protein